MGALTNPQTTTPNLLLLLADWLTKQWLGDTNGILNGVTAEDGAPSSVVILPPTNLLPAVWAGHGLGYDLVLLGGAVNVQLGARLYSGYTFQRRGSSRTLQNGYLQDSAVTLAAGLAGKGIGASPNIIIAGHSMGGALGQVLADQLQTANPNLTPTTITFGSPAPGGTGLADRGNRMSGIRVFNDDDPIPLLPLSVDLAPWIVQFFDGASLRVAPQFVQWRGGISITTLGAATPAVDPPIAAVAPVASIAQWLVSLDSNFGNSHSLTEYLRRIRIWWSLQRATTSNVSPTSPADVSTTTTRQAIAAAQSRTTNVITTTGQVQQAAPQLLPATQIFSTFRAGREWYVAFGGTAVILAPHRRGARSLAAIGNLFLRKLQRTALVTPASFVQQFQAYLTAAADPNGGFSPILSTSLHF